MEFRCNEDMYNGIDQQLGSRNMETCCSDEFPWEGDWLVSHQIYEVTKMRSVQETLYAGIVTAVAGETDWPADPTSQATLASTCRFSQFAVVTCSPSCDGKANLTFLSIQVGTFYSEHGDFTYEWSYENKCIPGQNIENIEGGITYEDCAQRCLACKDDNRCNASMGPCIGIEWFTVGSYKGRCTLSRASSGPPCDNTIYGVQFYSFKELHHVRLSHHGRALIEEDNPDTHICVFAQNPSALHSDLLSQGGWVHHDLYEELGTAGFTITKEVEGSTSTISMDIMCTESDHVTLPSITSSDEVYGLCTSGSPGVSASSSDSITYTAVSIARLYGALPIMWDDSIDGGIYQVGGSQGICIFFAQTQQGEWASSLTSFGWIDRGHPAGFGHPNQLALYCLYELDAAADIQLPAFSGFGDIQLPPFSSLGIHHGLCTFGNVEADPSSSDSTLTYERVVISSNEPIQMWGEAGGAIVNLAYLKNAWQSATLEGGDASRAVDGNTDGNW
ncbi:hypothetical protein THAOC_32983, partial [Thalassiosira oceanica]